MLEVVTRAWATEVKHGDTYCCKPLFETGQGSPYLGYALNGHQPLTASPLTPNGRPEASYFPGTRAFCLSAGIIVVNAAKTKPPSLCTCRPGRSRCD